MYRAKGPVQMRQVGEVEFANGVAAMGASGVSGETRVCAGIVGYAGLGLGAPVETVLEAMIAAGGGRFRGIRYIAASHPDQAACGSAIIRPEGLLLDRRVREGFARLAPLGLSSMPGCTTPSSASSSIWRAPFRKRRSCSTSRRRDRPRTLCRQARRGVRRLERGSATGGMPQCPYQARRARHADVRLHPSQRDLPPSRRNSPVWRPYMETCIAAFGAERAMFESNFPVDKGSGGYAVFWNAFKRIAAGCSTAEKATMFSGTARKF